MIELFCKNVRIMLVRNDFNACLTLILVIIMVNELRAGADKIRHMLVVLRNICLREMLVLAQLKIGERRSN